MRISDWCSDVCSSDLPTGAVYPRKLLQALVALARRHGLLLMSDEIYDGITYDDARFEPLAPLACEVPCLSFGGLSKVHRACGYRVGWARSEEHTSELQSLMRISYAVFCLKKKNNIRVIKTNRA